MDNVLKKAIREEIEKYNKEKGEGSESEGILPVNASPATLKGKKKSKALQTERRLSNLLEKIRSKSCIKGGAKSSSKKMKRLQVKYERFDPISKTYKLVRQKDGGGPRFIDVYAEDTILFKDIRAKIEKLFFDNENYNYFVEELREYVTSINDITGQQLDENESLWDYLKRKRIILSRTTLVLRSCIETLFYLSLKKENIEDWFINSVMMIYLMKISHPFRFQFSVQMFWMAVESALHQSESYVIHVAPLTLKMSA